MAKTNASAARLMLRTLARIGGRAEDAQNDELRATIFAVIRCFDVPEYGIVIGPLAAEELAELRPFDHRAIRDAIADQLARQPLLRSKHRKPLAPPPAALRSQLETLFDGPVPEAWQLRVGAWRVIYVVAKKTTYVLRVIYKGGRTTDDALS